MGFVGSAIEGTKKAIPWLAAKIGTVLLFFLTLGFFLGYWLSSQGYNEFVLVLPVIAMLVMWKKLDEGVLLLILFAIFVWIAPEIFMR